MGTVYFLRTANGRYYVGSTNDLDRRLEQHARGTVAATRWIRPLELVFHQRYPTLTEARMMERWLKRQKDRSLLEKIISDGKIRKHLGP